MRTLHAIIVAVSMAACTAWAGTGLNCQVLEPGVKCEKADAVSPLAKSFRKSVEDYRLTGRTRHFRDAVRDAEAALALPAELQADPRIASVLLEFSQYVDAAARSRYRAAAERNIARPQPFELAQPLAEARQRLTELKRKEASRAVIRTMLANVSPLPDGELLARTGLGEKTLLKFAEPALREPIPDTADALYEEFWETGNRSHYQKVYFERLKNICAMALAEYRAKDGRYLARIADYLNAFCEMKTWILPAHDWVDGGRQNLMGTNVTVDLFSSEVAAKLACVLRLVGDRLDPALVRRVKAETERRIFAPLRRELAGGSALGNPKRLNWWTQCENNWNAVCWDNTVCAALGCLDDADDRALFVQGALRGMPFYFSGFTPDGYCSEGMGYWNYGFGHHLMMGRLLRFATDGKLDIFTHPIQRKVAAYARSYTLVKGFSPAFADGNGAVIGQYLGYVDEIWPDLPKELPPVSEFPDGQVWLLRAAGENGLSVALKGGHNGESHNHNDIGSYAVVKGRALVGGDPGGEEYTRFTFSKQRYESKLNNSYGHPVPVVGGKLQSAGRKFAARVVSTDLSSPRATVVLDISAAYEVPALKKLTRTFVYDRAAGTFTVTDRVEFSKPTTFESAYVTFRREDNEKAYGSFGWKVRPEVSVKGGSYKLAEEAIANPNRLSPYRVGVRMEGDVSSAEISFTYR